MEQWMEMSFWERSVDRAIDWLIVSGPSIVIIFVLALILLRLSDVAVKQLGKITLERMENRCDVDCNEVEKRLATLQRIFLKTLRIVVAIIVGMLLMRKFGVDIAPLIAGAGIVGLAVGFGAQELVRDVISGIFMLVEDQVRVGDVAVVNGTGGLVEHIGMRTIILRDPSGTVHIFQNGKVNSLSNMTKTWSAMVFDIGVAYKEDTDKVTEIMAEVGQGLAADPDFAQNIIEPLEIFGLHEFGDSAVIIRARLKTRPGQQWALGREYRRRLKKAFDKKGVEIPFPHRTLYWGEESRPVDIALMQAQAKRGEEA
ncbi:MAG: mechanosensitive ion channel family protein [Desulfatibacillaceae bacterium]|nr:mechanosensitive ion channel family protein [Desulfatibacillaceae bacterium]